MRCSLACPDPRTPTHALISESFRVLALKDSSPWRAKGHLKFQHGAVVRVSFWCVTRAVTTDKRQYGGLANTSGPFSTCPNCEIGDIDAIWLLVIGSQCKIRVSLAICGTDLDTARLEI